jgi:pimeloyl-ACP methyl ester carboxylesterase
MLRVAPCLESTIVNAVLKARVAPNRATVQGTPADYGMPDYEAVDILATDGVRLSAWVIAAPRASAKLAVFNHPLSACRTGDTAGLDGVKINFMPMLKAVHDAGYHVLTYDSRAHGESDGGLGKAQLGPKELPCGGGCTEWQDVQGVMAYIAAKPTLNACEICLVGICMGANSMFMAWSKCPQAFDLTKVKCMVALQPTRGRGMIGRVTLHKLGKDIAAKVDDAQLAKYGIPFMDSAQEVRSVRVPVLFVQMQADKYTEGPCELTPAGGISDARTIFDACPTEKEMLWVGPGTASPHLTGLRYEAYSYFNEHPDKLLAWCEKHLGKGEAETERAPATASWY